MNSGFRAGEGGIGGKADMRAVIHSQMGDDAKRLELSINDRLGAGVKRAVAAELGKSLKNKATVVAIGRVIAEAVTSEVAACKSEFTVFILPTFKHSTTNLFTQLSQVFQKGIKEYIEQLEMQAGGVEGSNEESRRQLEQRLEEKGRETRQVGGIRGKTREDIKAMKADMRDVIHSQMGDDAKRLELSINDRLGAGVKRAVAAELGKSLKNKATVVAIGRVIAEAVTSEVAACKSEFTVFILPTFKHSTTNLFTQLSQVFQKGIKEYIEQLEMQAGGVEGSNEESRRQLEQRLEEKGRETRQVGGIRGKTREDIKAMKADMRDVIHSQMGDDAKRLELSINDRLGAGVERAVAAELGKSLKNKATVVAIGRVIAEAVTSEVAACKSEFTVFILPTFKHSTTNLFTQLSQVFQKGIKEYIEQLEMQAGGVEGSNEESRRQLEQRLEEKGRETRQVGGIRGKTREDIKAMKADMRDVIHSQMGDDAKRLELSINDRLGAGVERAVAAELGKSLKNKATVVAIGRVIAEAVTSEVAACKSEFTVFILPTFKHSTTNLFTQLSQVFQKGIKESYLSNDRLGAGVERAVASHQRSSR